MLSVPTASLQARESLNPHAPTTAPSAKRRGKARSQTPFPMARMVNADHVWLGLIVLGVLMATFAAWKSAKVPSASAADEALRVEVLAVAVGACLGFSCAGMVMIPLHLQRLRRPFSSSRCKMPSPFTPAHAQTLHPECHGFTSLKKPFAADKATFAVPPAEVMVCHCGVRRSAVVSKR